MEDILSWQTGFFTLAVFVFSFFTRRTLEAIFPTLRKDTPDTVWTRVWEMVALPVVPVLVGMLLAGVVKNWPFPPSLENAGPRIIYGAVCGFFSSWSYRLIKTLVYQRFNVEGAKEVEKGDTSPPPPGGLQ